MFQALHLLLEQFAFLEVRSEMRSSEPQQHHPHVTRLIMKRLADNDHNPGKPGRISSAAKTLLELADAKGKTTTCHILCPVEIAVFFLSLGKTSCE
jgi:hypothetical protein